MSRPTPAPHLRDPNLNNPLSFEEAWHQAHTQPERIYHTARGSAFRVRAALAGRGPRKGQRVLRFMRPSGESSRAYQECWGCVSNVNRTYIDVYTQAMHP